MRGSFAKLGAEFVGNLLDNKVGRALNPFAAGVIENTNPISLFNRDQFGKLANLNMAKISSTGKNYFSGKQLTPTPDGLLWSNADAGRAKMRRIGGGITGGLLAANMLGANPLGATDAANNVAMLGAHGAIGYGMMKMTGKARLAGIGYLAAAGINTFRRGDNIGPM
jgi:hypothetical protein